MTKSTIFKLAWTIVKKFGYTFSEGLTLAWAKAKLLKNLHKGVTNFTFIKKSTGLDRKAIGTLNADLFSYESKGSNAAKNPFTVKFWDLQKNAFRSLDIRTLKAA